MKPLQGFLQGLLPHRIRGWAFDPNDPDQHLTIEVRLDGVVIAGGVASEVFPDLAQKRIGQGDHGFLIALDPPLALDAGAVPEVVAVSSGGQRRVLGLPKPVVARPEPTSDDAAGAPRPPVAGAYPHVGTEDMAASPVFVLGAARSGTSAMVRALMRTGKYGVFNEGHLLPLALRLSHLVQTYYAKSARDAAPGTKTLIAHVPEREIHEFIHAGFIGVMRRVFPSGCWLDKTPGAEMIRAAPLMHRLWPRARFIFMRRDPVDNIESRRRKFTSMNFTEHCRLWSEAMMAWYSVRSSLSGHAIEIDQLTMAVQPLPLVEKIAALLELNDEEASLLAEAMTTVRPQITGSDPASHVTLAEVDWSDQERGIFKSLCAEPARLFGY